MREDALASGMTADARLGHVLWDLVHALTTGLLLSAPVLAVVAVAWLASKRGRT